MPKEEPSELYVTIPKVTQTIDAFVLLLYSSAHFFPNYKEHKKNPISLPSFPKKKKKTLPEPPGPAYYYSIANINKGQPKPNSKDRKK